MSWWMGCPPQLWLSCGQVFVGILYFQSFSPGVELLGHMKIPCLTHWRLTATLVSSLVASFVTLYILHLHNSVGRALIFHILANTHFPFLKILAILVGVKWYLMVVWFAFSLITSDMEHLFRCLLAICLCSCIQLLCSVLIKSLTFYRDLNLNVRLQA